MQCHGQHYADSCTREGRKQEICVLAQVKYARARVSVIYDCQLGSSSRALKDDKSMQVTFCQCLPFQLQAEIYVYIQYMCVQLILC